MHGNRGADCECELKQMYVLIAKHARGVISQCSTLRYSFARSITKRRISKWAIAIPLRRNLPFATDIATGILLTV